MLLKLEHSHSKWFQDEYPQIIFAWKLENTLNDSDHIINVTLALFLAV